MNLSSNETSNVIDFFYNHIVLIEFGLRKKGKLKRFWVTAFVLSIKQNWFLVTAGHCLKEVDTAIRDEYELEYTTLHDYFGRDASYDVSVPLDYREAQKLIDFTDAGTDFGLIGLDSHYINLLIKNNILPFSEDFWKVKVPGDATYCLIGIPTSGISDAENIADVQLHLVAIQKLEEKPAVFSQVTIPSIFGIIPHLQELASIEGMSGGPVIAMYKTEQDKFSYALIGVQSQWQPSSRIIQAPKIEYVVERLEKHFQ
jgi:hypothetical protein